MKFNVDQYYFSNGSNPRGVGHWIFDFGEGRIESAPNAMSYSEAKRWAVKRAKELGLGSKDTIRVCP